MVMLAADALEGVGPAGVDLSLIHILICYSSNFFCGNRLKVVFKKFIYFDDNRSHDLIPVSYTHLDVYKRQH